jgi:uncharacterized protein DUF4012
VLLGVVVVVLVGFTGYQALKAKSALEQVAADFEKLSGQLASGDESGARATLTDAQRHAKDARSNTHGPGWWLSARIPQIGPNVTAVASVAEVVDDLASDVLPDVLDASRTLSPQRLRPVNGRIDLAPLRATAPSIERAAARLAQQARLVNAIDTDSLAPQIAAPVHDLDVKVGDASRLADRASRAVRLLPAMLGGDGPRRYLFMFQNNAEIRASGGIPGAFATLTADDGRVRLGRQDDAGTIGHFAKPPTPVTAEEKRLFGTALGVYPQDVNFTPDFPRTAELIAGMYKARNGRSVDGVVSVDPVALSYLLKGTGPVKTVRGLTLTSDSAVRLLLSQVYADIPDPDRQNIFFNRVARSVFDAVSSGEGSPRTLLESLTTSASQRRLLVWSSRPEEEQLLAPTALAGRLETNATDAPQIGVYFNAARPYKLDYYLDYETSVKSASCVRGRQHLEVSVDLASRVPHAYSKLPAYVAPPVPQFGRGNIVVTVYFFAPVDGAVRRIAVDGKEEQATMQRLYGRPVFARTLTVDPGGRTSLTVDVTGGEDQRATPQLQVTPGVRSTGLGTVQESAC